MRKLAWLMLLTGCTGAHLTAATASGPAECSGEFDAAALTALSSGATPAPVVLYEEPCDGGLYLVALDDGKPLLKVNQSWRMWTLDHVELESGGNALTLTAQFVTGIGPTGAIPFEVSFRVAKDAEGVWQAEQLPPDETKPVELQPGVLEITNSEQLENTGLSRGDEPVALNPDFTSTRLVLKSLWLTSGAEKVTAIDVHRNDRGYFITYTSETPRIATTDMKHVVLYVELPRDHRYASFEEPEFNSRPFRTRSGVLEHATFIGALTP